MTTQGMAHHFARVFYRKAINIGLPILEYPEASQHMKADDELSIDFETGFIRNLTTEKAYLIELFPPVIQNIISSGGLLTSLKGGQK